MGSTQLANQMTNFDGCATKLQKINYNYNVLSKVVWGNIFSSITRPTSPWNLHFSYILVPQKTHCYKDLNFIYFICVKCNLVLKVSPIKNSNFLLFLKLPSISKEVKTKSKIFTLSLKKHISHTTTGKGTTPLSSKGEYISYLSSCRTT